MPGYTSNPDYAGGDVLTAAKLNVDKSNIEYATGRQAGQTEFTLPTGVTLVADAFEDRDGNSILHPPIYATGSGTGAVVSLAALTKSGTWRVTATGSFSATEGYAGYYFTGTLTLAGAGTLSAHVPAKSTRPSGTGTYYMPLACDAYVAGLKGDVVTLTFAAEATLGGGESAEIAEVIVIAEYLGD